LPPLRKTSVPMVPREEGRRNIPDGRGASFRKGGKGGKKTENRLLHEGRELRLFVPPSRKKEREGEANPTKKGRNPNRERGGKGRVALHHRKKKKGEKSSFFFLI